MRATYGMGSEPVKRSVRQPPPTSGDGRPGRWPVLDRYRSKIVDVPDGDCLWWTERSPAALSDIRLLQPGTTPSAIVNNSTAAEVIAIPARLACLTAVTAQPRARRAQLVRPA
jgi:hypothetical protein